MKGLFKRIVAWVEDADDVYSNAPKFYCRAFTVIVSGVALLAGVIAAIAWTVDTYYPTVLLGYALLALYPLYRYVVWLFDIKRGTKDGSDRESQEGSQDSSSSTSGGSLSAAYNSLSSYSFSFGTPPTPDPRVDEQALEEVESDLPILAHRSAMLRFDATDKPFGSVNPGWATFGVDADASCQGHYANNFRYGGGHAAPEVGCSCGFYALPPDLAATYEGPGFVTLMVELSGTVIEHDKGYRAGHQRVIECKLPACPYCGQRSDVVTVADHVMQQATCKAHVPVASPGQVFIDCADLASLIPVPIVRAGRVPVQS